MARELTAGMIREAASIGTLNLQLVYFRGGVDSPPECVASQWMSDRARLAAMMARVECRAGYTQITRILRHAQHETLEAKVGAVVFIGDACEPQNDDLDKLAAPAIALGRLRTPVFAFQEGTEPGTEQRSVNSLNGRVAHMGALTPDRRVSSASCSKQPRRSRSAVSRRSKAAKTRVPSSCSGRSSETRDPVGKRSDYERVPQDLYETPMSAVTALLPWLEPATRFVDPCIGRGALVGHLKRAGHVLVAGYDLPDDARHAHYAAFEDENVIAISNPPCWGRPKDLHTLLANISNQTTFWALLQHDWLGEPGFGRDGAKGPKNCSGRKGEVHPGFATAGWTMSSGSSSPVRATSRLSSSFAIRKQTLDRLGRRPGPYRRSRARPVEVGGSVVGRPSQSQRASIAEPVDAISQGRRLSGGQGDFR